jgi:hypothetical protein
MFIAPARSNDSKLPRFYDAIHQEWSGGFVMLKVSRGWGGLVLFALLSYGTSASAVSLTAVLDPGTTQFTTALAAADVATGQDMAGMRVTAFFSNNTTQQVVWGATGTEAGGVVGTGWQLTQAGNTIDFDWTLTSSTALNITRLLIDAGLGNAVFDAIETPAGTPNSGLGFPFTETSAVGTFSVLPTYRDVVALKGSLPVGDTFRVLDLSFTNAGGFAPGNSLTFLADTDRLGVPGDIAPVPEPGTFVLLTTALVTMLGYRWRFHKLSKRP